MIAGSQILAGAWRKIEDGVYTGLAVSGRHVSKWADGDYQRYTAEPDSVLISDFANPHSSFTLIKADGTSVLRKFNKSQERFRPMSVAVTNDMIFKLAHEIAEELGEPFGGHHIERARKRLALQDHADTMAKATPQKPDETLPRRARAAELSHAFGKGDQSRRVEFGDISLKLGDGNALDGHRVMVTHDQAADEIVIRGHAIPLHRIDSEVRGAFYVASAAFLNHLQDQQEQIQARSLIEWW